MRRPMRDKGGRGGTTSVKGITAPWRGLNTRDRLSAQSTQFATILDNFVPENGEIILRNPYSIHATGMTGNIETLMSYSAGGSEKLFAAVGDDIYDVTSKAAVGAAAVSSLTNARFSHTMFGTTSGSYLICTNGADGVRSYNGSSWATPTITGATSADLNFVTVHKGRLWFIEKQSMSLWYLATNAIAGAAAEFPVDGLLKLGGTLVAASSWSLDAGDGQDDLFVILSSEGEVLIYSGTDPADDYSLVGVYKADRPIGNRCFVKYGGELVILTRSGPVACSELMRAVNVEEQRFAELVRSDFVQAAITNATDYGWQAMAYSSRGWLIFNIPVTSNTETFRQYALNEGAWFRLRDQPSSCWGQVGSKLYFGGNGVVYLADDPDATDDAGEPVVAEVQWAWSRFGTAAKKRFVMARPHMEASSGPNPFIEMKVDYDERTITNIPTITDTSATAAWDVGVWDEAAWAGPIRVYSQPIGISGIGHVGALRLRIETSTLEEFRVKGAEIIFETGGVL